MFGEKGKEREDGEEIERIKLSFNGLSVPSPRRRRMLILKSRRQSKDPPWCKLHVEYNALHCQQPDIRVDRCIP